MRRSLVAAAMAAVLVMMMAGTALAGEITGSGKGGPNSDGVTGAVGNAASACLYSGLEDGSEGGPGGPGAPPQNWGHTHKAPFVLDSRGASWVLIDATVFGAPPGTVVEEGCNPHVGGEG